MEEINKYYIPNITELYCGYECEVKFNKLDVSDEWRKVKIGDIQQDIDIVPLTKFRNLKKNNRIRTKYLDIEDIENTGFVKVGEEKIQLTWNNEFNFSENYFEFKDWSLILYKDSSETEIIIFEHTRYEPSYKGSCPSINELNKILKLLKIK